VSWLGLGPHSPGLGTRYIKSHLQRGSWAEAIAVSWLLHRNWTVCKNVSGHGFVDLVATRAQGLRGAKTRLIDVKYYNEDNRTYTKLTDQQRYAGVWILLVHGDGNCEFIDETEKGLKNEDTESDV